MSIKEVLVNSINIFLSPRTEYSGSNTIIDGTVIQTFYPFKDSIDQVKITLGSGSFEVTIQGRDVSVTNTLNPSSIDEYTISVNEECTSFESFTIRIEGKGTIPLGIEYFGGTCNLTKPIVFDAGSLEIATEAYPMREVELSSLPRIAIDITRRRRIVSHYLLGQMLVSDEYIVEIYSLYPKELDIIANILEKAFVSKQSDFDELVVIYPVNISRIEYVRPDIFTKSIRLLGMRLI